MTIAKPYEKNVYIQYIRELIDDQDKVRKHYYRSLTDKYPHIKSILESLKDNNFTASEKIRHYIELKAIEDSTDSLEPVMLKHYLCSKIMHTIVMMLESNTVLIMQGIPDMFDSVRLNKNTNDTVVTVNSNVGFTPDLVRFDLLVGLIGPSNRSITMISASDVSQCHISKCNPTQYFTKIFWNLKNVNLLKSDIRLESNTVKSLDLTDSSISHHCLPECTDLYLTDCTIMDTKRLFYEFTKLLRLNIKTCRIIKVSDLCIPTVDKITFSGNNVTEINPSLLEDIPIIIT